MNGREKKIADDIATAIVDLMFPVVGEERGGEEADKKISLTHVTHPALRHYAAFVARETGRSLMMSSRIHHKWLFVTGAGSAV